MSNSNENSPYVLGEKYFIRTISNYFTGKLVSIHERSLVLSDAAWIPDTGRFSDSLKTGQFNEVEPYPGEVIVNMDAIVDASVFNHELPRQQK